MASSRSAKFRAASVAVTSDTKSDYQISDVAARDCLSSPALDSLVPETEGTPA
jgi:hypothetical protein